MPDIIQKCVKTGREFVITEGEQEMLKKFDVPLPTLHPEERWKQRLHFRNYRYLHYRDCDFCKKKTLSTYPAGTPFPVYCVHCFYNGSWSAPEMDFHFDENFFPQFKKLLLQSPHLAVALAEPLENSDYNNGASALKNCYMNFNSNNNEDCYYCQKVISSKNVVDGVNIWGSEIVYSTVTADSSYMIFWSEQVQKCVECYFVFNCTDAQNCFMSSNLRHKQYVFRNKQMTKEEYEKATALVEMKTSEGINALKKEFNELKKTTPIKFMAGFKNENVSGNLISTSKDVYNSFFIVDGENIWHSSDLQGGKDCMDQSMFNAVGGGELIYSACGVGLGAYNIKFSRFCWTDVSNLEYCSMCTNSVKDCFGCTSLHKTQNRIFNKQYTPAEYVEIKEKIKSHMRETGEYGQFFPVDFSFYGYNETCAQYDFPLTREEAAAQGFAWTERPMPPLQPDTIVCTKTGRPFRMQKPEAAFYEKYNIPFPTIHPDERFYELYANLGPFTLGTRKCSKCNAEIKTVYTDAARTVFCETCYQKEVI